MMKSMLVLLVVITSGVLAREISSDLSIENAPHTNSRLFQDPFSRLISYFPIIGRLVTGIPPRRPPTPSVPQTPSIPQTPIAPTPIESTPTKPTPGQVTPIQMVDLDPECVGADREVLVLTIDWLPGGADGPHRHDACVYVYVLEGEIEMKVSSSEEITRLKAGDSYYEGPNDIHEVGRNAHQDKPAKFLVTMIKKKGVDPVLSAN